MLEQQQQQLTLGLQELYTRVKNGQGWVGAPLEEMCHGKALTHDILERLGALKRDGHPRCEKFEEHLPGLEQRLVFGAHDFMQRAPWSERDSEADQSLVYEELSPDLLFFEYPLEMDLVTPTLSSQSPCQQSVRIVPPAKGQLFRSSVPDQSDMDPAPLQCQTWASAAARLSDDMEYITRNESPVSSDGLSARMSEQRGLIASMMYCLPISILEEEKDSQAFFNPAMGQESDLCCAFQD